MAMGIKSKFCANCGKETTELVDGFCMDCLLEKEPVSVTQKITLRICPKCNSIFWRGLWMTSKKPVEHYLRAMIMPKIKVKSPIEVKDVIIEEIGKEGKIKLILKIGDLTVEHTKKVYVNLQKFACPPCSREKKQNYMAIVQIRSSKDPHKLVTSASKTIQKYKTSIITIKELARGIDIYMLDKNSAHNMAKAIKQKYKLQMGTSAKAFSWNKDKDRPQYRTTIILKE